MGMRAVAACPFCRPEGSAVQQMFGNRAHCRGAARVLLKAVSSRARATRTSTILVMATLATTLAITQAITLATAATTAAAAIIMRMVLMVVTLVGVTTIS